MKRHRKALARLLAVLALLAATVALIVVVSDSLGGGNSNSDHRKIGKQEPDTGKKGQKNPPKKAYVVQPGDTLSSIAEKTGVSIAKLQQLNPGIDPQILIAGDKLKLR
jgi:LysM repeat protein